MRPSYQRSTGSYYLPGNEILFNYATKPCAACGVELRDIQPGSVEDVCSFRCALVLIERELVLLEQLEGIDA